MRFSIKKLICAAVLGGALLFNGAVEAGVVTDRLPLTCYCDHQVSTYNTPDGGRVGYISANVDLIQVTQVRNDGWAYGTYPTSRGRVSRWFRISDLCADVNYSNRSANVSGAQNVFRTNNGGDTIGSVSNNESIIVIADNGSRAQIVYRLDNGTGYKMGWIPSSAVATNAARNVTNVVRYATLNDGWYKISPLHAPNRLLDVNAASTAVGANIQLWDNASSVSQPNQVFYLQNRGNNWFTLKAGHCDLNVAAANTNGELRTNIQLASPNANSAAQLWRLVYSSTNGAYYIESRIRDKLAFDCAEAKDGNGTNIWLWEYNDVNWNKWRFTPVRPPTSTPTTSNIKGDVNGDGKVDNNDMTLLKEYIVGKTTSINKSNADVNGDGNINIVDLSQLNSLINKQPTPNPTPVVQQRQAKQTVPAFNDSGLSNRTGNERVDAGDMVTVLDETSNAYKVRYPTPSGTKDRWVSKDIFNDPPQGQISLNVPILKQTAWPKAMIGTRSIAARGCTITSLAMKYNYHNHTNLTPPEMMERLRPFTGDNGNDVDWNIVKSRLGYTTDFVTNKPPLTNEWMAKIYNQLRRGNPVVIGAYDYHWVVVKGYTGSSTTNFKASDFQINDPSNNFTNLQQFINKYNGGLRGIVY